jgi:hypothetical protein
VAEEEEDVVVELLGVGRKVGSVAFLKRPNPLVLLL